MLLHQSVIPWHQRAYGTKESVPRHQRVDAVVPKSQRDGIKEKKTIS